MPRPLRFPHKKLVALDDEMLAAIDGWRRDRHSVPNQAEAIRILLRDQLRALGHLSSNEEGTRPEDLNASNDD